MNLWKRLMRVGTVAATAALMYNGAAELNNTQEANATLQEPTEQTETETAVTESEENSTVADGYTMDESETETIAEDTDAAKSTEAVSETPETEPGSETASEYSETELDSEAFETDRNTEAPSESPETELDSEAVSETSETESDTETALSTDTDHTTEAQSDKSTSESTSETPESETAKEDFETESAVTEATSETEFSTDPVIEYTDESGNYIDLTGQYLTSSQYLLTPSFQELRTDLEDMIADYEGSWSIYVKDLKSSISLTINDQPQDSASLIKLYIAGAVLEEIQNQNLEETETIDRLLSEMISLSDNEAANELVRYLSDDHDHQDGLKKVNAFIQKHDFSDTHQYNGLEDSRLWYETTANATSVRDCGRFLEDVYDGNMVSHLASRQLEGYLLNQHITWKIPAGIPSEIKTANKTGEKDNTQNDVSLVYTPYRDYIICVMATDLTDEDRAVENIRAVSKKVYEFFLEADSMTKISVSSEDETEEE